MGFTNATSALRAVPAKQFSSPRLLAIQSNVSSTDLEVTPSRNSKELPAVHLVEEFTESETSFTIFTMTTVMSPMPKQQTKAASAALKERVGGKGGQTMKAIYLDRKAGTEALVAGEIPRPKPQAGEVLVKVHATSVMPTELQWFTTFNLPFGEPRPYPIVLSHEFSGVVESVGAKVNGFNVGDEVFGLNDWFINGAQAEFCIARRPGWPANRNRSSMFRLRSFRFRR